jgi:hypothetical protein
MSRNPPQCHSRNALDPSLFLDASSGLFPGLRLNTHTDKFLIQEEKPSDITHFGFWIRTGQEAGTSPEFWEYALMFGFVFPCVHLPSVHVPAYAEPCHIPAKY